MKKTLVTLVLSMVGFAPVFGGATGAAQQPATPQPTPSKSAETKKIAGQGDETQDPSTPTRKPKLILMADNSCTTCPCPKDKEISAEKKETQKTPSQTPAKNNPPKIALA